MAMVGSLLLNTDDDHEDSDFFDQLANEFNDGDLGRLQRGRCQQEEKERLDDAFSKLMLGEEDSGPSHGRTLVSSTAEKTSEMNTTEDDSWLEEEKFEQGAAESNSSIVAGEALLEDAYPQLNASIAADTPQSSVNLHAEPDHVVKDELLVKKSPSSVSSENNIIVEEPPESISWQESGSKDVCTPECGTSESNTSFRPPNLPEEVSELDSTSFAANESKEARSSTLVENVSRTLGDECLDAVNNPVQFETLKASLEDLSSDCAKPISNADAVVATESSSIKELQWSSFGNSYVPDAFGSYSDFFSQLDGQAVPCANEETTAPIAGSQDKSSIDPPFSLNVQENLSARGESFELQTASVFNGLAAGHSGEVDFWNQQGFYSYGINEQDNFSSTNTLPGLSESQYAVESKHSGISSDAISEAGTMNYSSVATNYQAQPMDEAQESWENVYPGWYFDYASNEWRQIEGWGAVQEQQASREDGDPSYLQKSQVVGTTSEPVGQSNQGQGLWPATEPSGTHFSSEQQYASNSLPEQQANWEEQYPGWYYDYQTQQWCQVPDDGGQSLASNQDLQFGTSQGAESVQNFQSSGGGWVDQQVQPHYESQVSQSVYSPEQSHSLSGSSKGGDMSILTRGISFNSWAEPTTKGSEFGQQEVGDVNSWTGFQSQRVPGPASQSQQDFTAADKPSFFGQPQSFFQPHNTSTSVMEGARSSEGRPAHALVAFGFGGRLVTMKAPQLGNAEPLLLHDLNTLVAEAGQCDHNDASGYFSALNRQGLNGPLCGATSKDVLKWVDEQVENCGKEDPQGMNSKGLRVLWGVLRIACLHYGKLRSVGVSVGIKSQMEDGPEVALGRLLTAAKSHGHWNQGLTPAMDVLPSVPTGHQLQAAVDEVRNYLMDGKRKEALQFAQQGQLWGLALVLASQLGEKVYADTILQMAQQQFSPGSPMRTLLLLFAGQSSELFRIQSLPLTNGTYGSFSSSAYNVQDSAGGMLRDWLGNLSIIAANPTKGDEQVLTHLGDSLWKDQGEVAGAHTCYLVADASFESFSKEARLCLLGADHFKFQRTFATPQAIQRTEVYEYAKTLGNPQYVLVPFQPYKLLYAHMLAEAGRITEACRYCQLVVKNLRSAGRGADVEFCKLSAVALEERLRFHSQGGYSFNFSTGKLVGKVMGTIDSTIHKIIGGPPIPQQATSAFSSPPLSQQFGSPVQNSQGWYASERNMNSSTKAAPIIPSASNNNLSSVNSQVDVPMRSVSEPNLMRQELNAATTSPETSSVSPNQLKSAGSNGGYFGRFGSQIVKAIGFIKHKKEAKLGDENKFFYDEKLKRWVEAGAEPNAEETVLAPPPIVASFNPSMGSPSEVKSGGESQGQGASLSSSADLPPMPPSVNQFSARGRLHGVRSRYVDTFNKGNVQAAAKPPPSPVVPAAVGGWGVASSPSQFFASASSSAVTNDGSDVLGNGQSNYANQEFQMPKGYIQAENEPLLPKNLNTSFMDVPVLQKRSSMGDIAMLADDDRTPVKSDASSFGNMARAVSWSGGSPDTMLSNGSIADSQTKTSMNSASMSMLPSPPILEPPPFYAGYDSGQVQEGAAAGTLSGSLQGATFGEMQEVEL